MKESYWGYWLIVLGIFIVIVLLLVQSFTSTNTQDYYMVKTITEASLEDAIDYSYYRTYGEAKINKEKFEESFLRRFAEEASLTTTYKIEFSDLYEAPPKVSVKVSSKAGGFSVTGSNNDIDIINKIDSILESSEYVSSTESVTTSSGQTAADINEIYNLIGNTSNDKIGQLKNCKFKFIGDLCGHYGETNVTVTKCGLPDVNAINAEYGFKKDGVTPMYSVDKNEVYCVFAVSTDTKCGGMASFDELLTYHCD